MININVEKNNNKINKVEILGHAKYDDLGKDIVCASVSSIAITSINGILSLYPKSLVYEKSEGHLLIQVKENIEEVHVLLDNMINMLSELAKDYPQNVKIIYKEVYRC
jgi:uncharacterized protein